METLVANLAGSVRREHSDGRDYLVAPITLLVPGVLPGSKGPKLYSLEDIRASATAWDGMPLLLGHPSTATGRDPRVMEATGLGTVYNATVNGKLTAEGWFDIEKSNRLNPSIISRINAGERIEVSTGLRIDVEETTGVVNGVQYDGIARNYKPDHLAVLLDKVGACSVEDGCGVNNQTPTKKESVMKLTDQQRKEIIDNLVANCECWEKDDLELLEQADDRSLSLYNQALEANTKLKEATTNLDKAAAMLKQQKAIVKAAQAGFQTGNDQFSLNEKGEWEKKEIKNKKEEDPKPQTIKMEDLPKELQEDIAFARNEKESRKTKLIDQIISNASQLNDEQKQAQRQRLSGRCLDELEQDALLAVKEQEATSNQSYLGSSLVGNTSKAYTPDPLGLPTYDFEPAKS